MKFQQTRGPVTDALLDPLGRSDFVPLNELHEAVERALRHSGDILYDGDLQLALLYLYELGYSGLESVS